MDTVARWSVAVSITILFIGKGVVQHTPLDWAAKASDRYLVYPDQAYGFFSGTSLKLDVWQAQTKDPVPTVIYTAATIAFWGNRTGALPYLMPWLARGWNVVNVEYRMSGTALAPAAVKDIRCALRWAYRNAKQFHLDIDRIIATGNRREAISRSWPGMLTEDAGLDKNCPSDPNYAEPPFKVAAVVAWYGPTDVGDLLSGLDRKTYVISWLGSLPDQATHESVRLRIQLGKTRIFHRRCCLMVAYVEE